MSRYVFKLPDLGEGTVEAEIVEWRLRPGEFATEDQPLVEMSTDKAVVELPSPVTGRLLSVAGKPGDAIAVGAELAVFEATGSTTTEPAGEAPVQREAAGGTVAVARPQLPPEAPGVGSQRALASPATRRQAREAGIDLAGIRGSGPGGRILALDLHTLEEGITALPVIGVRRVIAERLSEAKRVAPHFAYVEEVDITALEALRQSLNARLPGDEPPLSYLPFVVAALVPVLAEFPQCNAHFDAARNLILRHRAIHVGIATQTADGLKVPVVRDVAGRTIQELAAAIRRVTEAAREHRIGREELSGSTITLTSLGKLGGIVSTPILNLPEVAIVGLNKASERAVVINGNITIRRIMNLSSSFDHRFVDGFDAAAMIQALKVRLENPATLPLD